VKMEVKNQGQKGKRGTILSRVGPKPESNMGEMGKSLKKRIESRRRSC